MENEDCGCSSRDEEAYCLYKKKYAPPIDRCFYEIFAVATFEFWKMQSRQRTEQLFTVFARRNSDNHILQSDIKIIYIYR